MKKMARAFAALVLAVAAVPAGIAAASAAPASPSTTQECGSGYNYVPDVGCSPVKGVASAACLKDAAYLSYAVDVPGARSVDVTWRNPGGADVVVTGQPLSGTLLWPGAVVTGGVGSDWPGWTVQPDGTWARGDAYDWAAGDVTVAFAASGADAAVAPALAPAAQVQVVANVKYPAATVACSTLPRRSGALSETVVGGKGSSVKSGTLGVSILASTGSEVTPIVAGAAALIVVGGTLLGLRRRRRSEV